MTNVNKAVRAVLASVMILLTLIALPVWANDHESSYDYNNDQALSAVFKQHGVQGTLVIQQLGTDARWVHNAERASIRYSPASTFKIPNTLIALSHGVVTSETSPFKWDGQQRWFDAWNQDHDLQSAYRVSCLWCYQQIAQQLSTESYTQDLNALNYGNRTVGKALTSFWLDGSLAISAKEQIDFLTRLINNALPYPKTLQALTKTIMLERDADQYQLYAKTGWAAGHINIGWYVGYVKTPKHIWVFAMNMDLADIKRAGLRRKIVFQAFTDLGVDLKP